MKRRRRSANANSGSDSADYYYGTDSTDYNSNFDAIADLLQLDAEPSMDYYSNSGSGFVEGSGRYEGSGGYEGSTDMSNTNGKHQILQRYIINSLKIFFLFVFMFVKRGL